MGAWEMNITITTKENSDYKVVEPKKEELSACGKTKAEFLEACNEYCSNVEFNDNGGWRRTNNYIKKNMNDRFDIDGIYNYRIKPTSIPKLEELLNGCEIILRNKNVYYNVKELEFIVNSYGSSISKVIYDNQLKWKHTTMLDIMKITSPDGELIWEREV